MRLRSSLDLMFFYAGLGLFIAGAGALSPPFGVMVAGAALMLWAFVQIEPPSVPVEVPQPDIDFCS